MMVKWQQQEEKEGAPTKKKTTYNFTTFIYKQIIRKDQD